MKKFFLAVGLFCFIAQTIPFESRQKDLHKLFDNVKQAKIGKSMEYFGLGLILLSTQYGDRVRDHAPFALLGAVICLCGALLFDHTDTEVQAQYACWPIPNRWQ